MPQFKRVDSKRCNWNYGSAKCTCAKDGFPKNLCGDKTVDCAYEYHFGDINLSQSCREPKWVYQDLPTYPGGFKLIKADVECKSADTRLGKMSSVAACAAACRAAANCALFIFGKANKAGECWHEDTSDAIAKSNTAVGICSEGLESDSYNFYQLGVKPGSSR